MPLLRVEVRNEYSLGAVELYRDVNKDDPKELLEGVTVAGLVGVLRQLGDLAEFAAEVFHGLQEDVAVTSSRSRKLLTRVQRIEAAVSPLEKAILAQRSHLHFAYTSGSNWHTRIRSQENHFVYSEVPQFIMDSYEGCRSPPRLEILDKFDPGGPGSCLKRYSDPTFFKRASVASGEAHIEKIPKYKDRKIKKRRSWPRSGRVSHDASFSYHSGRTQFTQLNNGVHTPLSQTTSIYDATQTSELGERSNLYSRNGSDYIEADSRPSYSKQPDELESRESITSPLKRHDNDFLDYTFIDEKVTEAYGDIHISPSQELAGCSSSSGTWDVKTETVEPATMPSNHGGMTENNGMYCVNDGTTEVDDHDANLEPPSPNIELESLTDKAVDFDTVNKIYLHPSNKVIPAPKFDNVKLEDVESEPDHFMDALNTIESESETDTDFMKKQVDHSDMLKHDGVQDGLQEYVEKNVECRFPNSDSEVLASSSPVNAHGEDDLVSLSEIPSHAAKSSIDGVGKDESKSMPLGAEPLQSTETAREFLNMSIPQSVISCENGYIPEDTKTAENGHIPDDTKTAHEDGNIDVETNFSNGTGKPDDDGTNAVSISGPVSSFNYEVNRSGLPILDGTKANPESEKHVPETSNISSFTFWTNGGLLGLQPSKPPDYSLLNSHPNGNGETSLCDQRDDEGTGKVDPEPNLKNIEGFHDSESSTWSEYQKSGASFRKLSWKISPSDLDISSLYANKKATADSVTASGNFRSSDSTSFADNNKATEIINTSSRIFKFGDRFLTSGSNKKPMPGGDGNSIPSGIQSSQTSVERKNHQNFQNQAFTGRNKFQFTGESAMMSPSASPPLEHMKISFQPIDGLETSKLKLKFPDGNNDYGGNVNDLFPSFQLVPEVSIAPHDVGSDSDDDTFYRSSPSLSDGHHSFRSESNSEQWESGESSTSKDHELYDALHRISLSESVSTTVPKSEQTASFEGFHETHGLQFPSVENGQQNPQNSRSFDLQSLDTLNRSFREESVICSNSKNDAETRSGPALSPSPPPMPPIQWRDMKPNLDDPENKHTPMTEGFSYSFDHKISGSKISQQPKPAPFNHIQIAEAVNMQKSKKLNSLVSNGQRERNLGRRTDEKDFLHQIRTKSFNLRPTVTSKPAVPSTNGSANVQVTEILKRANAIRQAVGSDDGDEDSNWSDA